MTIAECDTMSVEIAQIWKHKRAVTTPREATEAETFYIIARVALLLGQGETAILLAELSKALKT